MYSFLYSAGVSRYYQRFLSWFSCDAFGFFGIWSHKILHDPSSFKRVKFAKVIGKEKNGIIVIDNPVLVWWSIGDSNPWPRQCECRALTKHAYIRPDAMIELTCFWDLISFGDASRKALWRDKKVNDDVVMPVNGNLFNHPRQNHLLGIVAGGIKFFGPVVDLLNL